MAWQLQLLTGQWLCSASDSNSLKPLEYGGGSGKGQPAVRFLWSLELSTDYGPYKMS